MIVKNIEELIREHLLFTHGSNSKGWNRIYCEVCGDGSRTKGPRGGWLFSGDACFYHCFNCGIDGNFDPNREHPYSKDMVEIFESFGIPKDEYFAVAYAKKVFGDTKEIKKPKLITANSISMPEYFVILQKAKKDNVIAQKAYAELEYRNISPDDYPFFISNGKSTTGNPKDASIAKALMNRLIIPIFNEHGDLIYYQGRALDRDTKIKYINADVPKTSIIYGMHRLAMNQNSPLYICEGFFDAYHVNGVCTFENNFTSNQIAILNKSRRKKVFIPDRKSDSSKAVDQCIKLGWSVALPDIGTECKDIDDAVRKYGKMHVIKEVASNIYDDANDAKIMMKLNGYLI